MTGNGLPAPVGDGHDPTIEDVRHYATVMALAGTLINLTSTYYDAPEGEASHEAEMALEAHVDSVTALGPDIAATVMQALASIIVETGKESLIQEWFDAKAEHVRAALHG